MAQRSAIVFLTPGQLAGQMHTPRIHCKEHMRTEKIRFQHQNWPKKTGSISGPTICSLAYWGLVLGAADWSAKRASKRSFFFFLFPYHLGLNIWSAWRQLQRSLCARLLHHQKGLCSKFPCAIIIICDQHSYYDYKHTHTVYLYIIWGMIPF